MGETLHGRDLARRIEAEAAARAAEGGSIPPGLAVVLVGDDPASRTYVKSKEKACARAGFRSMVHELPADVSETFLLALLDRLNRDPEVHAILCQLPLPPGISASRVAAAVDPLKDVDGFHPENVGRLWRGEDCIVPCTPLGIMRLLADAGVVIRGRRAVVIGRSVIVGRPMAALLVQADATVTIAHSKTPDLAGCCRGADILISAAGVPGLVTEGFVREGAVVVDVGTSSVEGRLKGDVDFDAVLGRASLVTPVPGGVGPLTIALLMENTLRCRELQDARGPARTS